MSDQKILHQAIGVPALLNVIYPSVSEARAAAIGDIRLVQSPETGLVYNLDFNGALLEYDARYQNEQACSPRFQAHLEDAIGLISTHFSETDYGIEIGCGKGYFLEMARKSGMRLTGYDPAYEGSSKHVVKAFYDHSVADVKPDYFVMRHVLEHIPNPWGYLRSLANTLQAPCPIFIEVPNFDWIVENYAFYDIFYEHCNYFSLDCLSSAFGKVFEARSAFGGQYLQLIADLATFSTPKKFYGHFYGSLEFSSKIDEVLDRMDNDRDNYIWGAGAKGVTMANILLARGRSIKALIDINPVKQGGFIGISALPVQSPEAVLSEIKKANVLIMNPNYSEEISTLLEGYDINQLAVA